MNEEKGTEAAIEIRIVGFNDDKTRRVDGSEHVYNVYFELSGIPPRPWEALFEGEWKLVNVAHPDLWKAAHVDKNFIVMRCPLEQVVSLHLPFLRKAVAATNVKYTHYVAGIANEPMNRMVMWERERKETEALKAAVSG